MNCEAAQVIRTKDLDALLVKQWKILVERDRKPNKTYNESGYRLKYKAFTMKRTIQKIWHQARLKVIPTNKFLYNIKCSATFKCKFDNKCETNEHFLIECKGYEELEIRNQQKTERMALKQLRIKLRNNSRNSSKHN